MKKRLMSTLLMGAFFIASTSMFVSCKDYDDDINANTKAIQNVESSLKAQIAELNSALQQEKTANTAAHAQYQDAIAKAQAAADACKADLAQAIADANSTHATKSELSALQTVVSSKASQDNLEAAIANLKTALSIAISEGDAATAAKAQSDLVAAIDKVNAALDGVKGDIAAVTNAQTEIKNTLTAAIAAVDAKVDTKASQASVDALSSAVSTKASQASVDALATALADLKQSAATQEAVQNALDITKGEVAQNIQVVQAAADKAQADATSAKQDLSKLAENVSAYAAAQAKSETKIEALEAALKTAQDLEKELQNAIATNSADIKVINNQIATLDAQIKSVNDDLSKLIEKNSNSIQDLLGTVGNIDLQVKALEKFCGNLDALNVAGIRDSMRLSFAELKAAKQEAAENLAAAEVRAALTAAGFVAVLNAELTERIDSLRDNYATDEELAAAAAAVTTIMTKYVDDLDVPALQATVDKFVEDLGDNSLADILTNLEWVNKTLTWTNSGEIINLEAELAGIDFEFDMIDEWADEIDKFVEDVRNNVAGYQTSAEVQALIDNAIKDKDGKEKYVALNQINALLADVAMAETYKAAGVAMTSDLSAYAKSSDLDDYLKKADIDLTKVGASIGEAKAEAIAKQAIEDANLATKAELSDAVKNYDAQLAESLKKLFEAVKPVAANGDEAEEANKTAAEIIEEIAAAYAAEGGISPAVVEQINLLKIQFSQALTSLVFYPEYYYGGIESIEITALKIDEIFALNSNKGTANETFKATQQKTREFDLFPNGFAKYHINPVNADLTGYELAFIDHTAITRSADDPYLVPVETNAAKNKRDANDVLWVEFENNAEVYNAINNISSIPSMGHYSYTEYLSYGQDYFAGSTKEAHYVYGQGKDGGKGIVTALTATNEDLEGEASYVTSDYALIVPVTINGLILANAKENGDNEYETSTDITSGYLEDTKEEYYCNAAMKFHLHQKAIERVKDEDNAVNTLKYDQQFNLKDLVETHFVNSAKGANADEKMDDDLFERLNLDYRFYPIDYTTDDITGKNTTNFTSETKFMTLTEKDPVDGTKFNGIGYFNQVKDNKEQNGEKIKGANPFGGEYLLANKACVGRRPVVRVELYNKETNIIYAVGYLKIEIVEEEAVNAETFDMIANSNKLFATCEVEVFSDLNYDGYKWDLQFVSTDYMELRWDQVQAQLNNLVGGTGLTPADWNLYTVEDGQYFKDAEGNFQLIAETYDPEEYPYYEFGWLNKGEDLKSQGNHTDVLRWFFENCDYQSLFFDLQSRYSENNKIIDKKTGKVQEAITRYFKLTSPNKANPDLYIGLTIPAGYIYYPAGEVGKVQGAFWKQAAKNTAGDNDIILNTDMIVASGKNEAAPSVDVSNGKFLKNLIDKFFGEKIVIDFSKGTYSALSGDDLAEAKKRFEEGLFKNRYAEAPFYFRKPNASDENEKKVYDENGQWVVYGLSGNKYTLQVTDLQEYDYSIITTTSGSSISYETKKGYYNYGSSVSVVAVNDILLGRSEENKPNLKIVAEALGLVNPNYAPKTSSQTPEEYAAARKAAYEAAQEAGLNILMNTIQRIQMGDGKNLADQNKGYCAGIRIMTLDTDPKSPTFSKIELLTQLLTSKSQDDNFAPNTFSTNAAYNAVVKGITQDMLNYKKHNSEGDVERPYNKQLTAFVGLYAIDEAIYAMPGCDNFKWSEDNSSEPYAKNPCYILPGYNQNDMECSYCKPSIMENAILNTYDGCFRPFVSNKTFAVRFYDPVSIESGEGATLTDADLKENTWTVAYSKLVKFTDWANYTPSSAFKNFISYYGIDVQLPDEFKNPAASQAAALAQANGVKEVKDSDAPKDPNTVKTEAGFGYTLFTTETAYDKIYAAAKAVPAAPEAEAPEESAAPVAPKNVAGQTMSKAPSLTDELYAQADVPTYGVMIPSYNTNGQLVTANSAVAGYVTGDDMTEDKQPTLGTAPYTFTEATDNAGNGWDSYSITAPDFTPKAKPTLTNNKTDKTKAPEWVKSGDSYKFKWYAADGTATTEAEEWTAAQKKSVEDIVATVTTDNYTTKLDEITIPYMKTAYTNWFKKQDNLELALTDYYLSSLVYRYYVADATAWSEFFEGDLQEATSDQINAAMNATGDAKLSFYDEEATYYVTDLSTGSQAKTDGYTCTVTTNPEYAKKDATTSIAQANADKEAAYNADMALWNAYQEELAKFATTAEGPYKDYQSYLAAQAYIQAYEVSYKPKNDLTDPALAAGTASEVNYPAAKKAYDADKAKWDAAFASAMSDLEGEQDLAWKRLVYSDMDIVGGASARPALKDAADIEKLHTLAEIAPEKFVFEITNWTDIKDTGKGNNGTQNFDGSFSAYYQNTNYNTNLPFHLYIPLYVTYNYLNEAPAAPKVVYAVLTVNSTTGNSETGK